MTKTDAMRKMIEDQAYEERWGKSTKEAFLSAFEAALAEEREACLQICLGIHQLHRWQNGFDMQTGAYDCAEAIRARGKTDVTSVLKDGQAE